MRQPVGSSIARGAAASLFCALLAGCYSFDEHADLAANDSLYADVAFTTRAPGDRSVFVAPLRDDRDAARRPIHDRGFPIRYGSDEFWARPVATMVEEILTRELATSQLFGSLVDRASPDTLILQPSLVTFAVGSQEAMAGSSTFADVALRLEIFGPVGAGEGAEDGEHGEQGARPKWHDRVYTNRQASGVGINPIRPYLIVGRALQLSIAQALHALDGSNVARLHVPVRIMVGQPAEASAPAAPPR